MLHLVNLIMSILIWNVWGINKKERKQDVRDHIQSSSPIIVALVETKVKINKFDRLKSCVPVPWPSCHNFQHSSKGRIWIA